MKTKKRKIKEEGGFVNPTKKSDHLAVRLFISLILTFLLIVALFIVRNTFFAQDEEYEVVRASVAIPENLVLTEDNINEYLTTEMIQAHALPENYYTEKEDLIGMIITDDLSKGTIITTNYVISESDIINKMDDPILMGFSVEDSVNAVNGCIRAGDIVDIVIPIGSNKFTTIKNVYVYQAFDSTSVLINKNDTTSVVSNINVYIEKAYSEAIVSCVNNGTVYINKVDYDESEDIFVVKLVEGVTGDSISTIGEKAESEDEDSAEDVISSLQKDEEEETEVETSEDETTSEYYSELGN